MSGSGVLIGLTQLLTYISALLTVMGQVGRELKPRRNQLFFGNGTDVFLSTFDCERGVYLRLYTSSSGMEVVVRYLDDGCLLCLALLIWIYFDGE